MKNFRERLLESVEFEKALSKARNKIERYTLCPAHIVCKAEGAHSCSVQIFAKSRFDDYYSEGFGKNYFSALKEAKERLLAQVYHNKDRRVTSRRKYQLEHREHRRLDIAV